MPALPLENIKGLQYWQDDKVILHYTFCSMWGAFRQTGHRLSVNVLLQVSNAIPVLLPPSWGHKGSIRLWHLCSWSRQKKGFILFSKCNVLAILGGSNDLPDGINEYKTLRQVLCFHAGVLTYLYGNLCAQPRSKLVCLIQSAIKVTGRTEKLYLQSVGAVCDQTNTGSFIWFSTHPPLRVWSPTIW